MKNFKCFEKKGSALVTTMYVVVVVSVLVTSMLLMVSQQHLLSKRSATWDQSLQAAEAGIDVGWNEINKLTAVNTNGIFMVGWSGSAPTWNLSNQTLSPLSGNDPSSTYSVVVTTNSPAPGQITITSTGVVSGVVMSIPVQRVVQVVAQQVSQFGWGILTKQTVELSGNAYVDSFDSSNPSKSTGGAYDSSKRQNNGNVGSNSSASPAISGSGSTVIYGIADTGPGGTVSAVVSPPVANAADMRINIPDIGLPIDAGTGLPWNTSSPAPISVSGGSPATLNSSPGATSTTITRYNVASINVSGNNTLTIGGQGTVQIYVSGLTTIGGTGQIILSPSPTNAVLKVELYAGNKVEVIGNGVNNLTGAAANFSIKGLPTCPEVEIEGNAAFVGTVYAPNSEVEIEGNVSFSGSVVGNTVEVEGNAGFHYDESLRTFSMVTSYSLVRWTEK